jgi:hypothetical protein
MTCGAEPVRKRRRRGVREPFYDRARREQPRSRKRLLDRPFWLNISRAHWKRRLPMFNTAHWRLVSNGQGMRPRESWLQFTEYRR